MIKSKLFVLKKKITINEKKILLSVVSDLNKVHIPSTFRKNNETHGTNHGRRTGAVNQRLGRQMTLGKVYFQGKIKKSVWLEKYPGVYRKLKKFMKSHRPDFSFHAVGINKNIVCKKHIDGKNAGRSVIVGSGEYKGGETVLYTKPIQEFNISNYSIEFNGSEVFHRNKKFSGTRYSFVFHSTKKPQK